jgi:nucleotide-binding universal stress UspA family protein
VTEFNRILVPLDGSALAEKALPVATTLAEKFKSTLILLRVLDIPTASAPTSHPEVAIDWVMAARQQALQEAESYLNARQAEIHRQGIRVRALIRDTSPAKDILNVGVDEKIDLIVISSHGEGGLPAGPSAA